MRILTSAVIVLMLFCPVASAGAPITYVVTDNHPSGGAGATSQQVMFQKGDPRFKVQGPGKCGDLFLGGFAFGHPDPRIKDPTAVCGHGYVIRVHHPITGPAPLSILPIEAPMPVESAASAADAAKIIRDLLPQLDRGDGDKVAGVLELRRIVRARDSLLAMKTTPKRQER